MAKAIGDQRGILLPQMVEQKFHLSRPKVAEDLKFFVEHFWIVSWDRRGQEPYLSETLPYPCVHMVIEKGRGNSKVYGVIQGRFSQLLEGKGGVFGVKFRPGAFYPFVKTPISEFTNKIIPLTHIFGSAGDALEKEMVAVEDEPQKVKIAEAFIRERLPACDEHVTLINIIIDQIIADRTILKVEDIVERQSLSKRSLQRLFHQYVGVSPKWVIQRYRLHEAAEQVAKGEVEDWAMLAQQLGYFDQAHFIKDFKAIVGKTPAEYAKQHSE